jgi:pantoate--beta-alanine ligase
MRAPTVLDTPAALRLASERWRAAGLMVGLVPTMGALHAGHVSLIRRAVDECDRVVVSIFVNPAQFRTGEDLERYPRPVEQDLAVCAGEGVAAVYLPRVEAVYPMGFATGVSVSGTLTAGFDAERRPGHFDGVALIVTKLLVAARADVAYFGAKDAQQCAVVRRLAADLDVGTRIAVCPTVRDHDGLALSSRNAYLSPGQRLQALAIPRGLAAAARAVADGVSDASAVVAAVELQLAASPDLEVEYVAAVDPESFAPVDTVTSGTQILVAARIGTTRLIDTLCAGVDEAPAVLPRAVATSVVGTAMAGRG